ncbi:hypothetical protein [Ciceribacter sp. RN22]|uniref:hypothetical protein n=1 Tax=Ciceribacter sp. RN22 TaxID=2954932 RepID=UPI002093A3D4|nr:hypothetical protein [Ciceribacter sp. RN22]MCO6178483.1 hypothetical protein [Ciceribacter sp. RN22]
MAFVSFLQRSMLVLASGTALAGCMSDELIPPAEIGDTSDSVMLEGAVGAETSGRRLIGRVGRVDREDVAESAYSAAPARNGGAQAIDYLDTPNLAGTNSGQAAAVPVASAPLDDAGDGVTDAAGRDGLAAPEQASAGAYAIPEEGINIDAGLGVAGGEVAAEETAEPVPTGPMTIAEGNTDQPVIDGIGTDNPVLLQPGAPQTTDGDL